MTDTQTSTDVVAQQPQEDRLARERAFIAELAGQDKGRLAVLRRNAGKSLAEARNVAWFHGLLAANAGSWHEEAYFLIATLFASDKDAIEGRNRCAGNFGATLRALRSKSSASASDSSPLDRRFDILLDADFDPANGGELAYRLRQLTKRIIAQKDPTVRINWAQLLNDIKFWNNENKLTQKRWARKYYAPNLDSQSDIPTE